MNRFDLTTRVARVTSAVLQGRRCGKFATMGDIPAERSEMWLVRQGRIVPVRYLPRHHETTISLGNSLPSPSLGLLLERSQVRDRNSFR
jgi:hypothetical protein